MNINELRQEISNKTEELGKKIEARQLSLEFYAPIYFLYHMYDDAEDKMEIMMIYKAHIERFIEKMKKEYGL